MIGIKLSSKGKKSAYSAQNKTASRAEARWRLVVGLAGREMVQPGRGRCGTLGMMIARVDKGDASA